LGAHSELERSERGVATHERRPRAAADRPFRRQGGGSARPVQS